MAVLGCCEATGEAQGRPVELVSFESDLASLRLALRNAARFPHLQSAAPNHLLRFGHWTAADRPLSWHLFEGDFLERMREAPLPDCILYDPFSAKTDTSMWTLDCFARLFSALSGASVELFTYSASTAVRTAMLGAGFYVGPGIPTGARPETTIAMTPTVLDGKESSRELLGQDWLKRWHRSHARYPADVKEPEQEERIDRTILAHPQFDAR